MQDRAPPQRFTVPVAVHIFLLQDERILLLRHAHTGYEDGNYSVPARHLDGGELVLQAAAREAREETEVELDPETTYVVGIMHRRSNDERVDLRLARGDGALTLMISDDGVGFDPVESRQGHLGLQSMRERLAVLRGTIDVESAPARGARLTVRIPVA